ncbi:hypothetical protein ACRCPG_13905 [Pseudomonas aeruginosa]
MNLPVNIADLAIADRVYRRANANFYAVQLKALQDAVAESEYCFVQCAAEEEIPVLPKNLERAMEEAVMKARLNHLYPQATDEQKARWLEESTEDGFANCMMWAVLQALDDLGLRLQRHRQMYLPTEQVTFPPSPFDDENERPCAEVTSHRPSNRRHWWWPFTTSTGA